MTSLIDFTNHRFLVTGGSSGIGRRTAQELAALGADVIITGRDVQRLNETLASLGPGDHQMFAGDLTDYTNITALVDACGPLNGVVHATGRSGKAPLKLVSEKLLNEVMGTNFASPILLTQRLLAKSKIIPGGSIVFVASISAHTGTAGVGPYSASKAALLGFLRPAALELAPKKIRINALSPALVRTEMFRPEEADWLNEQEKRYPFGLGRPEDIAYAAAFLLSNAASYMTGQTIIMDGGCEWI
jgi:NAD(P)-dependent dehydrogenase (short-subunit alcohol dehydrogenase family)